MRYDMETSTIIYEAVKFRLRLSEKGSYKRMFYRFLSTLNAFNKVTKDGDFVRYLEIDDVHYSLDEYEVLTLFRDLVLPGKVLMTLGQYGQEFRSTLYYDGRPVSEDYPAMRPAELKDFMSYAAQTLKLKELDYVNVLELKRSEVSIEAVKDRLAYSDAYDGFFRSLLTVVRDIDVNGKAMMVDPTIANVPIVGHVLCSKQSGLCTTATRVVERYFNNLLP